MAQKTTGEKGQRLNEDTRHQILVAARVMRAYAESLETLVKMGRGHALLANEIAGAR